MSDRNFKEIRKQLRNVVREILPEVMASEAVSMIDRKVDSRLEGIQIQVRNTLQEIDQRSKDVQSFVIRQLASAGIAPSKAE